MKISSANLEKLYTFHINVSLLVKANFFSEFTRMIKNNAGHCLIMHYEKFMYLIFIAGMELDISINKSK